MEAPGRFRKAMCPKSQVLQHVTDDKFLICSEFPFGQLPVLEVNGQEIAQSAAIYRFLGRQFSLVPKCPLQEALVDAIYDAHKDFLSQTKDFVYTAIGIVSGDKEKLLEEVLVPGRNTYFGFIKKHLEKSGSGYLVGKTVSWADIVIADNLSVIHGLAPLLFDGYSEVKAFVDRIHELPELKKYLAERPPSSC